MPPAFVQVTVSPCVTVTAAGEKVSDGVALTDWSAASAGSDGKAEPEEEGGSNSRERAPPHVAADRTPPPG